MRVRWAALLALCVGGASGCATGEKADAGGWMARFHASPGPAGPDVVHFQAALLEVPLGDAYVNGELWRSADERVVGPGRKAAMEAGGLRVGLVSGLMTPPRLLELLTSERSNVAPRDLRVRAGKATPLPLGPALEVCRFQIERDGLPEEVEFHRAECRLVVTAAPAKDGQVTFRFTPEIVHGDKEDVFRPAEDRSAMTVVTRRPTEEYADLSWEATLSPNEYVVVGGRYDLPDTLGHAFFARPDEPKPVQRLLVLRAAAAKAGAKGDAKAPPPAALAADGGND